MARDKNGWIKLHSSILDKDFSAVEFKIWCGLLLLANSLKYNSPGLVDLSLREIAGRLDVSVEAIRQARDKFLKAERVEIVSVPGKTKPIMAIRIVNFSYYQGKENVPLNRQSVLPSRHSRIQNGDTKNTKKPKNSVPHTPRISNNGYVSELQKYMGFPDKVKIDPVPNPAKEAKFIDKMLQRGFTWPQIFDTWRAKVDSRGEFVSMVYVNEDIGKGGSSDGTHRRSVRPVPKSYEYKQPHEY